jgi:hypothetical protein
MEFQLLVEHANKGTPPGNGYGVFDHVTCPKCGMSWVAVTMLNTKGFNCGYCKFYNPDFTWMEMSEYKGEGAFLNPVGKDYPIVTKN